MFCCFVSDVLVLFDVVFIVGVLLFVVVVVVCSLSSALFVVIADCKFQCLFLLAATVVVVVCWSSCP